jgi:hypothetical protein
MYLQGSCYYFKTISDVQVLDIMLTNDTYLRANWYHAQRSIGCCRQTF